MRRRVDCILATRSFLNCGYSSRSDKRKARGIDSREDCGRADGLKNARTEDIGAGEAGD